MTTLNINDKVLELIEEFDDKNTIKGHLLISGYKEAEIVKALREAGIARTVSGFRAELYARLAEEDLTDEEFDYLIKSESNNVLKHKTHYKGIVQLVRDVRTNLA